jgi:glycosyltransferase involved in cell wall biosynthesis
MNDFNHAIETIPRASRLLFSLPAKGDEVVELPPRVHVIYNGIDLSVFTPRSDGPVEPLILGVGRLVEKKGFINLVKACRILKDEGVSFHCEIIGSGVLKSSIAEAVGTLGLNQAVRLRSQMAQQDVRAHYLKAMVVALPCLVAANGDRDLLPNVLKEAMAVGVPVVTTRLAGIEELLTHEVSGLLVAPGDAKALAQALRRLLDDAPLRRRLGAAARKVIEAKFDLRVNFTSLRDLLAEVGLEQTTVRGNGAQ